MSAERIICYSNEGISLYKVNDLNSRSYLTINKKGIIKLIEENTNDINLISMINSNLGKFDDEQLKKIFRYIINTNDYYREYRGVKEIIIEKENM
jgi:intein-encoded DNA endonuclease-like protein